MLYHYIDETYKKDSNFHHCCVGGLLIPIDKIVDFEIEIEKRIPKIMPDGSIEINFNEFKFTEFFRGKDDSEKISIFSSFIDVIESYNFEVVVSHAKISISKLQAMNLPQGQENLTLLSFAWLNMCKHLEAKTTKQFIQQVIDLGLNESFKPTYNRYIGTSSLIPAAISAGISEEDIFVPNFRKLPKPLFIDSKNSRAIQISDLIIGICLNRSTRSMSPLMTKFQENLSRIDDNIIFKSVEWNLNL